MSITTDQLQLGEAYYRLTFSDPDRCIPGVEPMIYVGCNIFPDDDPAKRIFYFQDTVSFACRGSAVSVESVAKHPEIEIRVFPVNANEIGSEVVSLSGAISAMESALRREQMPAGRQQFVASDDILAIRPTGERITIEVRIGLPYKVSEIEWRCPVSLTPIYGSLHDAPGNTSFQAICLALALVFKLLTHFCEDGGSLTNDDGTPYPLEAHYFPSGFGSQDLPHTGSS